MFEDFLEVISLSSALDEQKTDEVHRKSECLNKVFPENVDEERQNQVNVNWLKREDTRLLLEKTVFYLWIFQKGNDVNRHLPF